MTETFIMKKQGNRSLPLDRQRIFDYLERVTNGELTQDQVAKVAEKAIRNIEVRDTYEANNIPKSLANIALEEVDEANPDWVFHAAKIYLETLYKEASINRSYDTKDGKYGDFYGLQKTLAGKGVYSANLLEKYSHAEFKQAEKWIDPQRDYLFTYTGLYNLATRYLATDHEKNVYELPQERWMIIAMYLMQDEDTDKRMELVSEAYWALSNLLMTVATPTLANSGKSHGQLSSCFILTTDDSLQSIYDDNTDAANISKNGGGIGAYLGKIRARGSSIKGYKDISSGVVPWINYSPLTLQNVG